MTGGWAQARPGHVLESWGPRPGACGEALSSRARAQRCSESGTVFRRAAPLLAPGTGNRAAPTGLRRKRKHIKAGSQVGWAGL